MVALRSFDGLAGIAPSGGAGTAATPAPPNKSLAVRRGRRRPGRDPTRHGNHTVGWFATSSCGDGVLQNVAVILAAVPTPVSPGRGRHRRIPPAVYPPIVRDRRESVCRGQDDGDIVDVRPVRGRDR